MFATFGYGWLMMVLMIGLPILGVILVLMAAAGLFQNQRLNAAPMREQPQVERKINGSSSNFPISRYCANCGTGLQVDWTYCPQCGAPV